MKAGRAHSVVAAGIAKPALLARWLDKPALLREYDIDPATFDVYALWQFAGLVTKVRHSCLRADFPLTFRLLTVTGIEIEFFARYSLYQSSIPTWASDTPTMKAQHLLNFIETALEPNKWPHTLLSDVMRYEHALMKLRDLPIAEARSNGMFSGAASVPRLSGELILCVMRSDPREVSVELQRKSPVLESITRGSFHFGYWRAPSRTHIRVLELDEFGFYLLSLTDGQTTAMELCRKLTGRDDHIPTILDALRELGSFGIINFNSSASE